jgi:cytochrome b
VETTNAPPEAGPARRRVPARTRLDFWYDGLLLVAFTLAYSLGFTGLAVHEWLGLGIGLALLLHLTLHWDWVVRTTRKLFTRGGRDRGIYLVNLALLIVMTLCVLSGVLISQVALYQLGISVHPGPFWTNIHDTTSKLTLILVPIHVAMRWRWIVSVARRLLRRPWSSRRARYHDPERRPDLRLPAGREG